MSEFSPAIENLANMRNDYRDAANPVRRDLFVNKAFKQPSRQRIKLFLDGVQLIEGNRSGLAHHGRQSRQILLCQHLVRPMFAPIAVNPKREGTQNVADDRKIEKLTHRLIEKTFLSSVKVGGGTRIHAQNAFLSVSGASICPAPGT